MKRVHWLWLAPCLALTACELPFPIDEDEDDEEWEEPPVDLCAPLESSTTPVEETQVNDAYPTPEGGTIRDGVYDLVQFDIYSPASADDNVRQRRFVVMGDTIVSISSDPGSSEEILGGTFVTEGTDLKFAIACPQSGDFVMPYTATDDELWLFDPSEPNLQIYAKR